MSSGSRGLFEFMWKPSGSCDLEGDTNLRAGRNACGFDERRELRLAGEPRCATRSAGASAPEATATRRADLRMQPCTLFHFI